MKRRIAVPLVMWSLAATAGCSGDRAAGPSTPTCSSALASPLVLAIGAYTSLDPASDGGCVTIAANASTLDSAEYLIVPQSVAGPSPVLAVRAGDGQPGRGRDAGGPARRAGFVPTCHGRAV